MVVPLINLFGPTSERTGAHLGSGDGAEAEGDEEEAGGDGGTHCSLLGGRLIGSSGCVCDSGDGCAGCCE